MSALTILKSMVKKVPPIKKLIAERDELRSRITPTEKINPLLFKDKLYLIDFAFTSLQAHSFADLGGIWGVDGAYTFYTLDKYNLTKAVLVDFWIPDIVKERSNNYPQLKLISGNFGDKHVADNVGQVDVIFLFDVLLHEVAPDWDQILEMYAPQTQSFVIFNQQWIGSDHTIRLLDLGEEEYFRNIPHTNAEEPYLNLFQKLDQKLPNQEKMIWRNAPNLWQWGITDTDLKSKIEALGFRLQYFKNCGQFTNLKNFENHAFVFSKQSIQYRA
jgi:hypothetical protein